MNESFFGNPEFYAQRARLYDAMIGSSAYNKLFWGTSPNDYAAFAARAIGSGSGPLLEVAVGTARASRLLHLASARRTTLVDMSQPMLALAQETIRTAAGGRIPERITFECRDMLEPSSEQRYETILGLGLLHLIPDLPLVLSALGAQLDTSGSLFLGSLIKGSARSNTYLKLLKARGEIAEIRSASDIYEQAKDTNIGTVVVSHRGAMAYLVITR